MKDIPVNAKVECADGSCGESVTVIVDSPTQTVTHIVVKTVPDNVERLVDLDQIKDTTPSLIHLSCTKRELAEMEPFVEEHYLKVEEPISPQYGGPHAYATPYVVPADPAYVSVESERVPPGALAVHRGTRVEATDGKVGEVGELLVDPDSGHITHLILREGHLWGKRDVTLPISAIDRVIDDVVYLKLNKRAVQSLPAIPVSRHYAEKRGARTQQVELFVRVFDDTEKAGRNLADLRRSNLRGDIDIRGAATLVKDDAGKVSVAEQGDVDASHGALFGAITGGLLGLVGGPVGAVMGAATGAVAGGAAAKRIDMGLTDEFLQAFRERLEPGTSALVMIMGHESAHRFTDAMGDVSGVVLQETLTEEMVQQLLQASQQAQGDEPHT
jgi:uncharacterized membrane protein/sporulation protein YlmC with PRC-barrel domain